MGQQQNGYYNFGAADALQSALNLASEKLVSFGQFRAKLAATDLDCTDGNQVVGWTGTSYNKWLPLFNADQGSLQDAASQLKSLAAQVNNATYDAYLANGENPPIIQLPANVSVPSLPTGQPHANPDGLECATPLNLYDYANQTKGAHDAILPLCTRALQGKIDDYYAGSKSAYHSLIPDIEWLDIPPLIVDQVTKALSKCLNDDQSVYKVGVAFEDADNSSSITYPPYLPGSPQYIPPGHSAKSTAIIKLTANALNGDLARQQAQQAQQAGTDLAAYLRSHDDYIDDNFLQELKKHQDDPAFLAAFFAHIDNGVVYNLIELESGNSVYAAQDAGKYIPSIAHAFAVFFQSGPNNNTRTVADQMAWLIGSYPEFEKAFVDDLKKNHQAALGFMNSLSDSGLNQLAQNYETPPGHVVEGFISCYDLMTIASSAMLACTSSQANSLYTRIAGPNGFLSDMQSVDMPDLNALLPQFGAFLANYAAVELGPPKPGEDLTDWANQVGGFLRDKMQPFLSFIGKNYGQGNLVSSIAESTLIALFFSLVTAPISGPAAIAAGLGTDFLEDVLLPVLQNSLAPAGNPDTSMDLLKQSARATAQIFVAAQLAMQHRLYYNGHPATAAEIQGMLLKVTPDLQAGHQGAAHIDLSGWTVTGKGGGDLYAVMSAAGIRIDSTD